MILVTSKSLILAYYCGMKTYLSQWTISRVIQLMIGIAFLYNYCADESTFSLAFGFMMFVQAVLNIGCFSSKGCNTTISNPTNNLPYNIDDVEYEIINNE